MNIVVFDTETTSLEKPFCYNIGYVILDTETAEMKAKKDFVCEQVWHNPMLFTTAYYSDKRPLYVERMRKHTTIMNKYGYICQEMIRDFKAFNVKMAFAFNSAFDEKVFNFNCDWFKCNNPFDNIAIKDIRAWAIKYLVNDNYKAFCEELELFTDTGNYSTTAESFGKYLLDEEFTEEHTALSDSILESEILFRCIDKGGTLEEELTAPKSVPRVQEKILTIINGEEKIKYLCNGYTFYKSKDTIKLK